MNLGDLNAETVSHLKIPAKNLNFTIHSTWFPGQYSMVVITIFATDIPAMRDAIGTITFKGTSIKSCAHHSHVGRENVASALKTFCGSIEKAANFPREIMQLDLALCELSRLLPCSQKVPQYSFYLVPPALAAVSSAGLV